MRLLATIKETKQPVIILKFFVNEHGSPKAIFLNGYYLDSGYLEDFEAVMETEKEDK